LEDKKVDDDKIIEQLSEAILKAMPDLDATGRRVALALYHLLVKGQPVELAALAAHTGVPQKRVDEILAAWPGVFHDDRGRVIGFWGLALRDMPHGFEVDGTRILTWCAWDPLFIAPLLDKRARVDSRDPVSGETLTLTVTGEGVADLSHPGTVVSFLKPDAPWDHSVVQSFCHHVLFFTSAETGRQWTDGRDGALLLPVADAFEVGRRVNAGQFGPERAAMPLAAGSTRT